MNNRLIFKCLVLPLIVVTMIFFSACQNKADKNRIVLTYNYNNATSNTDITEVELRRNELSGVRLVVPQKEYFHFDGWYLDTDYQIKVSDAEGELIIGEEIFDVGSSNLYAKWIVNEEVTYKILMVYDTEVHADLETTDGKVIQVDYIMSDLEKQVCNAISFQFSSYLNQLFDGLVTFEIDSYFTKEPIYEDSIYHGVASYYGNEIKCYYIDAQNIDEISHITDDYRCVINTFSFNDYKELLHHAGGYGNEKFAKLYLENILGQTMLNYPSIEVLLDYSHSDWNSIMTSYAHEFTHTIEQGIAACSFHRVLAEYQSKGIPDHVATPLYLLNKATRLNSDELVGIPYTYWKNDILMVRYLASDGGYVDSTYDDDYWLGHTTQKVPRGSRTNTVIAYPFSGYKFVMWSDGVLTAERTDYNIQEDFTVYAIFEKIS